MSRIEKTRDKVTGSGKSSMLGDDRSICRLGDDELSPNHERRKSLEGGKGDVILNKRDIPTDSSVTTEIHVLWYTVRIDHHSRDSVEFGGITYLGSFG
jgi:hypothetical protein